MNRVLMEFWSGFSRSLAVNLRGFPGDLKHTHTHTPSLKKKGSNGTNVTVSGTIFGWNFNGISAPSCLRFRPVLDRFPSDDPRSSEKIGMHHDQSEKNPRIPPQDRPALFLPEMKRGGKEGGNNSSHQLWNWDPTQGNPVVSEKRIPQDRHTPSPFELDGGGVGRRE